MFSLIVQTLLLVAIAFILGAVIGCLLRGWFGKSSDAEADGEAAGSSAGGAAASGAVAAPGGAMLAAVVSDLQVQSIPTLLRKQAPQILLSLHNVPAIGQAPALSQSMNMSIHRKSRHTEGLRHDN